MKTKIFIIEDNEMVAFLLEHTLIENFDCKVSKVSQASKLFEELSECKPDIIVLDYNLRFDNLVISAESILDFCVRTLPSTSTIIFSGQTSKDVAVNLLKRGAVNYISKDSNDFHVEIVDATRDIVSYQKSQQEIKLRTSNITKTYAWIFVLLLVFGSITCLSFQ